MILPPKHKDISLRTDVKKCPDKSFMLYLVGSPGSGKSSFIYHLLNSENFYKGKFHYIFAISPNISELSLPIKKSRISHELNIKWLQDKIGYLKEKMKKKLNVLKMKKKRELSVFKPGETKDLEKKAKKKTAKINTNELRIKVLFIFDDLIASLKENETSAFLSKLIFNRRHFAVVNGHNMLSISMIITSQKYTMLPSKWRSNFSWIIFFKQNNMDIKKMLEETGDKNVNEILPEILKILKPAHSFVQIRLDLGGLIYDNFTQSEILNIE